MKCADSLQIRSRSVFQLYPTPKQNKPAPDINPLYQGISRVVDDNKATKKLNDKFGIQLVAVLPSNGENGAAGMKFDVWNTLFWVIEKSSGIPQNTKSLTHDNYRGEA